MGQENRLPGFGPQKGAERFSGFGPNAKLQAMMTEADRIGAKTSMAKYDRNRDDVLSGSELTSTGWTTTLVGQIDRDGDGALTLNEMALHWTNSRLESARNARNKARTAAKAKKKKQGFSIPSRPMDAISRQRLIAAGSLMNDLFKQSDRNGSKYLERYEWNTLGDQFGDVGRADGNNDNRISRDELTSWLLRRMGPAATWRLVKALRLLDADGDGQISMKEYTGEWTEAKYAEFLSLDTNRDGVISPKESYSPPTPVGSTSYSSYDSRFINRRQTVSTSVFVENDVQIRDLDVRVALTKPSEDHMSIILIGPDGEKIMLFAGGWTPWPGYVFENTLIDDEAPAITSQLREPPFPRRIVTNARAGKGATPKGTISYGRNNFKVVTPQMTPQNGVIIFSGGYPVQVNPTPVPAVAPKSTGSKTLKHYYGKSAKGEWKLVVTNRNDTVGLLREWSLVVTPTQ